MVIVAIPAKLSESAKQFFERGGKVVIPRPEECPYAGCLLNRPLRGNGSYLRQVAYWGVLFLVHIFRFRCGGCGRTVSCPYSWLAPYRRFVADAMAAGIESYATARETYRGVSTDLSDPEFVEPEMDIRHTQAYKSLLGEKGAGEAGGHAQTHASVQPQGEPAALKEGAVAECEDKQEVPTVPGGTQERADKQKWGTSTGAYNCVVLGRISEQALR